MAQLHKIEQPIAPCERSLCEEIEEMWLANNRDCGIGRFCRKHGDIELAAYERTQAKVKA